MSASAIAGERAGFLNHPLQVVVKRHRHTEQVTYLKFTNNDAAMQDTKHALFHPYANGGKVVLLPEFTTSVNIPWAVHTALFISAVAA